MGVYEPGSAVGSAAHSSESVRVSRKWCLAIGLQIAIICCWSGAAFASQDSGTDLFKNAFKSIFNSTPGWRHTSNEIDFSALIAKAQQALDRNRDFQGLFNDESVQFNATKTSADDYSATVRFTQTYKGLEVVGNEAMVHFDNQGAIHDTTGSALEINLDVQPRLTVLDAKRVLDARYGEKVKLSQAPELKVFKNFDGRAHLAYHMLTKSTETHDGQEVYVDAHDGSVVLEFDRAYHIDRGRRTVYSADTDKAHENTDSSGYPLDIDLKWYDKVIEDGERSDKIDRSAVNAYRSAGLVYAYYLGNFKRKSFDDKDTRIVSVVHMGKKMNNAFWTTEYNLMAYGDGDNERLTDLSYGLDVAAHEMTHGVTAYSAKLVYAAESGALNESYSDFFGKMVDYNGNWDIGGRIMSPKWNRRALRNMENPEEFKQPGSNDSPLRVPTTGPCTKANDRCGVHVNSGIPNKAAVLTVKAIGKQKTEQLYYKVLTKRLSATSTFKDMRRETEKECALMFGSATSTECEAVKKAFDTVKM